MTFETGVRNVFVLGRGITMERFQLGPLLSDDNQSGCLVT
jgi:hypothetical protein